MPGSGTKIETAIKGVQESIERSSSLASTMSAASDKVVETAGKAAEAGAMGIRGVVLNNVGNIAAMAIIAGAFLYLQREQIVQAREDRTMFRDNNKLTNETFQAAVKAINDSADRRYEKSETVHGKAMEKMGDRIEKMLVSSDAQTAAVMEAVKELKEGGRAISKTKAP